MTPHSGYKAAWLALHAAGIVLCHAWGLWGWYYAAVAAVEGVGLLRGSWGGRNNSGTWSWVVWEFLGRDDGFSILVTAGWSLWFTVGFMLNGWFPWASVNALVGMAFLVWLWPHFYSRARTLYGARRDPVPPPPPGDE